MRELSTVREALRVPYTDIPLLAGVAGVVVSFPHTKVPSTSTTCHLFTTRIALAGRATTSQGLITMVQGQVIPVVTR